MTGKILIELAVVALIAYGIWREEDLIDLEGKLWHWAKNRFKRAYRRFYGYYIEMLRRSLH